MPILLLILLPNLVEIMGKQFFDQSIKRKCIVTDLLWEKA